MNSRENQVFNLLLIEYIFSKKKMKSKKQKEKGAYGLSPGWKIAHIQMLSIIYLPSWWLKERQILLILLFIILKKTTPTYLSNLFKYNTKNHFMLVLTSNFNYIFLLVFAFADFINSERINQVWTQIQ